MNSDLSLEFLRVVEQAAIACAHTMGLGDRHKSDQAAVEAMRAVPRHGADRRHHRDRRRGARRGADAVHRREGRDRGAQGIPRGDLPKVDIAVDPLEGTNLCATGAPNAIAVLAASDAAACCTRPISTWRSSSSARAPSRRSASTRRCPRTCARSPRPSSATSRTSSSSCSIGRGTKQLIDQIRAAGARIRLISRRRSVGGHRRRGRRQRRPRGDGHRRRAGRRADGGRDAVPERRDLRASRRQQAGARGALPRDGDHGLQQVYTSKDLASATTSSSRPPA